MMRSFKINFILLTLLSSSLIAQTVSFKTFYYETIDDIFPNPERGFSAYRSSKLTESFVNGLRDENVTVIQRIYKIPQYRSEPFSDDYLDLIEADFNTARQGGAKLVLRFSYTDQQSGEDASLSVIMGHLDQLYPLFKKHFDVIAYVEAGFIGAWGEWYYSSNGLNNTADRRSVLFKELSVLPIQRSVVVRTPSYKRNIFEYTEPLTPDSAFSGSFRARTGAHNDCFLASSTDYGTYSHIETDKTYLNLDNRYVPQGGETCNPSAYSGCDNALVDLERMRWSVLNKDYHPDVLTGWVTNGCMEEIKRRLGYRFSLLEATLQDSVKPGGELKSGFKIHNSGFASPYNPRNLEIILRNIQSKDRYFLILNEDPRMWMAGDTVEVSISAGIPQDIPPGNYEILLHFADPLPLIHDRPEYSIRLANADVWEDSSGYNNLMNTLAVYEDAPGELYSGDSLFKPINDHPTGMIQDIKKDPSHFELEGNYPNPFNGSTVIKFSLKYHSRVRLDIININGKFIDRLVDKTYASGNHRIIWQPKHLSSGSYFYRITVDGYSQVGKTLYIK
jgi:hypothetical protein